MSIRHLVSKNKRRYNENGYDLDLVYIKPNLITMGYPATSIEASFRNPAKHVIRLLNSAHKNKYWVFNLCAEAKRHYHPSIFGYRVSYYGFEDHCPPPLNLLVDAVNRALQLYTVCEDLTLAIHCKAGKGRAGTVAICILMALEYQGKDTANLQGDGSDILARILKDYARVKTYDGKAITIPSQLRYLKYFSYFIRKQLPCISFSRVTEHPTLLLTSVGINNYPQTLRRGSERNAEVILRIVCYSGSKQIPTELVSKYIEFYNYKYSILPSGLVKDILPGVDPALSDSRDNSTQDGHDKHDKPDAAASDNNAVENGVVASTSEASDASTATMSNVTAQSTNVEHVVADQASSLQTLHTDDAAPLKYYTYSDAQKAIFNLHIPVQVVHATSAQTDNTSVPQPDNPAGTQKQPMPRSPGRSHTRDKEKSAGPCDPDIYANATVHLPIEAILPLSEPVLLQDEIQIEILKRNTKQCVASFRLNSSFLTNDSPFVVVDNDTICVTIPGTELDNVSSKQMWENTEIMLILTPGSV